MGQQMHFMISFCVLDFILILDFVFIVKLFPHMLVISDMIGGPWSSILVA